MIRALFALAMLAAPAAAQEIIITSPIDGSTTTIEDVPENDVRALSAAGAMLKGKSRVVQQVQSGGRTFYRLRAMGFVGLGDTRRFCSAMLAEGVDCIPVQVR